MIGIIYEDKEIVVCIKPRGILSQEASIGEESMISKLKENRDYIAPVHRLDRAVCGIMVYAKTPKAAANLSKQIQERTMIKEYEAVIHGVPAEEQGIMEDILFKDSAKNKSFVVKSMRKGAKKASLEYRILGTRIIGEETISMVHGRLHPGRPHQIRVQFASRKMPLMGDGKYGGRDHVKNIALCSTDLYFEHPTTGEPLHFSHKPNMEEEPWSLFQAE